MTEAFTPKHRKLRRGVAMAAGISVALVGLGIWAYATGGNLLGASFNGAAANAQGLGSFFAAKTKDPFTGHTWHAIDKTWPGTIVFNGKDKAVVLKPLGAPEIAGTYSYEIKHASSHNFAVAKLIEGTLRMTNTIGQVSTSSFKMENGDKLTLTYTTGQRPETYARLTEADVQDQRRQLEQLMRSGRLDKFQVPPALQSQTQ